jgi:hypothetical protein
MKNDVSNILSIIDMLPSFNKNETLGSILPDINVYHFDITWKELKPGQNGTFVAQNTSPRVVFQIQPNGVLSYVNKHGSVNEFDFNTFIKSRLVDNV